MLKSISLLTYLAVTAFKCYGQDFGSSLIEEDSKICQSICIDSIVPFSSNDTKSVNVYIRTHDLFGEWLNYPVVLNLFNQKGEAITDGVWDVTRYILSENSSDFFPVNLTTYLPPIDQIVAEFRWDNGECLIKSCQIDAPK